MEQEEGADDSASSTAYEGDISMAESQGSLEFSELAVSGTESESYVSTELETDANTPPAPLLAPTLKSKPRDPSSLLPTMHSSCSSRHPVDLRPQLSSRTVDLRPQLSSRTVDHRRQAELVQARSKIAHLEMEILGLRRATKRARIEEAAAGGQGAKVGEQERLHKLEQDRHELLEDLTSVREELAVAERELKEKTTQVSSLTAAYDKDTRSLQDQLTKVNTTAGSLHSENENLRLRLTSLEQQMELEAGLDEVQETFESSLESLRDRIQELEEAESKLHRAEAQIQELERKLRSQKQDFHFAEVVKGKVAQFGELERQNRLLVAENQVLREKSDNIDLLRYRLQTLQERYERLEGQGAQLARLELENKELRERLGGEFPPGEEGKEGGPPGVLSFPPALHCRIVDLQHREVLLLSKQGELETKVKLSEREATAASEALREVKQQLAQEKEESRNRDERLQRLEKKLLFVTKERDGCVNVLNSYRLDAGVDALLKENLTEMEQQLKRGKDRLATLESELEAACRALEGRSRRLCVITGGQLQRQSQGEGAKQEVKPE